MTNHDCKIKFTNCNRSLFLSHSTGIDAPRHSSITIAADELDIFVSEQMRKGSITKGN